MFLCLQHSVNPPFFTFLYWLPDGGTSQLNTLMITMSLFFPGIIPNYDELLQKYSVFVLCYTYLIHILIYIV